MHIGNNYSTKEVLFWTRKDIYLLLVISSIPVVLYQIFDLKWIAIPWLPVALLGTAVAFMGDLKTMLHMIAPGKQEKFGELL